MLLKPDQRPACILLDASAHQESAGHLPAYRRLNLMPPCSQGPMAPRYMAALIALAVLSATGLFGALPTIDTSGFGDSRHHWLHIRDTNRFIQVIPGQAEYRPDQVQEIVTNILLFQRENGGWPKDYDMLSILTPEQKAAVLATRSRADTSFDNGNLHSQVSYLPHTRAPGS